MLPAGGCGWKKSLKQNGKGQQECVSKMDLENSDFDDNLLKHEEELRPLICGYIFFEITNLQNRIFYFLQNGSAGSSEHSFQVFPVDE